MTVSTNKKEIVGNIHAIETLGAFDGPGLRYVLFLQGCPFKCQFCHNRDSWSTKTNKLMSVTDVLTDYKKYQSFYRDGGITVSGGEPMLQLEFLTELFKEAKKLNIHTCLDTSAACYTPSKVNKYDELLKYTDLVLLDIKHIDDTAHRVIVGDTNAHVLEFAKHLSEVDKDTIIRHVLLPTMNNDMKSLTRLRSFLDELKNIIDIDILPYHKSGITKWDKLGIEYQIRNISEPTKEEIKVVTEILKNRYKFKRQSN